jgi:regulatory protein
MSDDEPTITDVEASAMRFLARRGHSTGELRKKLQRREFPDDLIEQVLCDFTERGWLDDQEFAEHQAQILVRKEWGPNKIRAKLRKHGVPETIAEDVVAALDVVWVEIALSRVRSKYGELEDDRDRQRAFRHLTYRGFSGRTARAVVFDHT